MLTFYLKSSASRAINKEVRREMADKKADKAEKDGDGHPVKNMHGGERDPNRHKGYEHPKETFLDAGGDVLDEVVGAM